MSNNTDNNNTDKMSNKNQGWIERFTQWWEQTPVEGFLEDIENLLNQSAFIAILGRLGDLAIVVAIVTFVFGENVRRNNEVYTAWQTITNAQGQSGSGGRLEALHYLNSRILRFPWIGWTEEDWFWDKQNKSCKKKRLLGLRWNKQHLDGLSANQAYLANLKLCGAQLSQANLQDANLWYANLQQAKLGGANLQRAKLLYTNFEGANLEGANLEGANLGSAKLNNASLERTNLKGAFIVTPIEGPLKTPVGDIKRTDIKRKQIKSACNWTKAFYKVEWNNELQRLVVDEDLNQVYVEKLQKDLLSNPKKKPDCSKWE